MYNIRCFFCAWKAWHGTNVGTSFTAYMQWQLSVLACACLQMQAWSRIFLDPSLSMTADFASETTAHRSTCARRTQTKQDRTLGTENAGRARGLTSHKPPQHRGLVAIYVFCGWAALAWPRQLRVKMKCLAITSAKVQMQIKQILHVAVVYTGVSTAVTS